ncbi:S-layer homology domain-containing protein [Paenibacillus agaridevorans]|uniref:S-layer homology domain-containing protein n=1 Tax=Paenibacillus agaridevorans TaxID=171404 RepID=UPI001BE4B907|nr:S-layer homology domain-containing protein [Paenibacillus agaridevorans]
MGTRFQASKKVTALFLIMMMVIGSMPGLLTTGGGKVFAADFSGGDGSVENPYIITSPEELNAIRVYPDKHYKLANHIDLTEFLEEGNGLGGSTSWHPIDNFSGSLDGAGHIITGLKIDLSFNSLTGLFGFITATGSVTAIGLEDISITGLDLVGGIAGRLDGKISNSYTTGTVSGTGYVGGLAGQAVSNSSITNSYSMAATSGNSNVGGIAGSKYPTVTIENTYATGPIAATWSQGGIVGEYGPSRIINSYYDQITTGVYSGAGNGKSTEEMKLQTTFAGWDFDQIWFIRPHQYPQLRIFAHAEPVASPDPAGGSVAVGSEVTLTGERADIEIYYTTNGETPTRASSLYDSGTPIVINDDVTIKAIAVYSGKLDSPIMSKSYKIIRSAAPSTATLEKGTQYGAKLNNVTSLMEYKVNDGAFQRIAGTSVDNIPVQPGDKIFVRFLADDENPASYEQELLAAKEHIRLRTAATLTSTIGTVSELGTANESITDVPYSTSLADLRRAITPATNATFQIYRSDGTTPATEVVTGIKVIVTAEDGATQITYTVTMSALTAITTAAISGVAVPVVGEEPIRRINANEYTASVTWSPEVASRYAQGETYTATLTITPKRGYGLTGVPADFFTVAGATVVTNSADSGVVTAVFPATELIFSGGSGTTADPYHIGTAAGLNKVRDFLKSSFKLTADIDLSGYAEGAGWAPIGSDWYSGFEGNFDGNGYTIENLTINGTGSEFTGLFGYVETGATVNNVILENIDVGSSGGYVGGLAGASGGTITNSGVITGSVSGGDVSWAGGLVGYNFGTISDSFYEGNVIGTAVVAGGLVGYNESGTIVNSFAIGSISGLYTGGLVGSNGGLLSHSYFHGSANGTNVAAGLVGANSFRVENSYATGTVTGEGSLSGLVGMGDGSVSNSFYESEATGQTSLGTALTTAEMKTQASYTDWDFDGIWTIDSVVNNGYPYLRSSELQVTYNGNGEADGALPIAQTSYVRGDTVSVSGNTGNLVKRGYTFAGWNTLADGSGKNYSEADRFAITASKTLFAKWVSTSATLTSTIGTVSMGGTENEMIKNIPRTTTLEALKAAITPAAGASFEVYQTDGTTVATVLATGNKVIVTAEDGVTKVTYTVTVNEAAAPPNSGSVVPTPAKVISKDGSLTLPVGSLGEVSLEDQLTITVPVGAVNQELKLTISKWLDTEKVLIHKEVLASSVYEVLKNIAGHFIKPVTLTFTFDARNVKSGQGVAIFYFDEEKKEWVEVKGSKTRGNSITVEVDHFTKFAVLVVDQATGLPVSEEGAVTPAKPEISFSDIAGHWAEASIKQAVKDGIVNGYDDGTFKPGKTITRAEFTVMLMNALQVQEAGAELTFTDKAEIGGFAQAAVAQAVQAGIISGYSDGTFRANAKITRAEMATMMGKAFGLPLHPNAATSFADDGTIPVWAKSAVAALQERGIVNGTGANAFNPHKQATRAEAIVMLLNMNRE